MTAIVTTKFRVNNATQFTDSLITNNLYLFNGRPQPWTATQSGDNVPDTPTDSVTALNDLWKDMIAVKKIDYSNATNAIVRRIWTAGKYYDMYRSDYNGSSGQGVDYTTGLPTTRDSLYDSNFYVVTDEYQVFKCLDNKWNTNVVSQASVKPSIGAGGENTIIRGADGYAWKFMYELEPEDVSKFLTTDFMSVQVADANLQDNQPYYTQWLAQRDAIAGRIEAIVVTNGGTYSSIPTIYIDGDGTGATATAVLDSGGSVIYIRMTNQGTGYTYANITVGDPNLSGGGTATAMISPQGGHSTNAVEELGGYYVMLNCRLEYAEGSGDFPVDNDYRRIGLLMNPLAFGSTNVFSDSTGVANKSMVFTAGTVSGTFVADAIINGANGAQGKVVSWNATARTLRYIQLSTISFTAGIGVTTSPTGGSGTISALINPDLKAYSGTVLYYENRRPISRASDQIEDIKIVVEM